LGQARKTVRNDAGAEQTWVEKKFVAADHRGAADNQFTYPFIEAARSKFLNFFILSHQAGQNIHQVGDCGSST
jgi:hypothetical protein